MDTDQRQAAQSPELDSALDALGIEDASTVEARDGEMTTREIATGGVLGLSAFGIVVGAGALVIGVVLTVAVTLAPLLGMMFAG